MGKAVFIWQISPIFSTSGMMAGYGGIQRVKASRFCKRLQKEIEEKHLDYQVVLDDTNGDVYELIEKNYDVWIFAPGGKTRFFIPTEIREKIEGISKIYLEMLEYHNVDITKVVNIISSINKNIE